MTSAGGITSAPRVLLVGMPGTGKSAVAPLLAPRLGWGFVDTDAQIERISGLSISGYFSRHGEQVFREQETRCLNWVMTLNDPVVVAVGGGAVLDPANRTLLQDGGLVIWFRAAVDTLVRRLNTPNSRPLLAGNDLRTVLQRMDNERRPLYQEIATLTIDVDDGDADKVTDRALRALGRVGRWQPSR